MSLGLRDIDDNEGQDPAKFELFDLSSDDRSFFDTRGEGAWGDGQPDNFNQVENCVE